MSEFVKKEREAVMRGAGLISPDHNRRWETLPKQTVINYHVAFGTRANPHYK